MGSNIARGHRLAIRKLPQVSGELAAGRLYALVHDSGPTLDWVCSTLIGACALARAEWIAEVPSAYLGLDAVLKRGMESCLKQGDLRIFRAKTNEDGAICRLMLKELEFVGIAPDSLIIVEGADRFIGQGTTESLEKDVAAWQRWAEQTGCAILWICSRRAGQSAHEAELLRLAHRFSGIARLRESAGEVRWDIYYWFADEGWMADKSFRLGKDGGGNWGVDERDTLRAEPLEHALDEDDVFAMRAALPGGQAAPTGWRVFETIEQMNAALAAARAPTVVFHYNVGSSLEELARFVFELRRLTGPHIKIVVKEAGGRLRHSHEQLLLSMGVNVTLPSDTGFSRMLSLIKSIQGQVYSRAIPASFEEGMSSIMAVAQSGYQPPAEFMAIISDVIERTRSLGVHNVLVRLPLAPGLGMLEALRCCTMKRPGDMFTADEDSVYVFLFACEEHAVSTTLDRLFRLPVSVLFFEEMRFLSAEDILAVLSEFDQRAKISNCTDYSAALVENVVADPIAQTGKAAPVLKQARPPFSAVPRALALRVA